MQTLHWYIQRLRAMSPAEVGWRIRALLRERSDRVLLDWRSRAALARLAAKRSSAASPRWCTLEPGAWVGRGATEAQRCWVAGLLERAERLAAGRIPLFDLDAVCLGDPPRWNADLKHNRTAPLRFAGDIDYRRFDEVGDCKFVWEPSRHQHWVVLARAYRASGEPRYVAEILRQWETWLDACPTGRGMQWRSPLELGIRLINWVWVLDLIAPAALLTDALRTRIEQSAYMQAWDITRKYSRGSSANNHLIGEAAGVFVACSYFPGWPSAQQWQSQARQLLEQEIQRQTFSDGVCREQAFSYHLFDLQFFMIADAVARQAGAPLSAALGERLAAMRRYAATMLAAGGGLPQDGDGDDGYVLDLAANGRDAAAWVTATPGDSEVHQWLPGGAATAVGMGPRRDDPLQSTAFAEAGQYLLQSGRASDQSAISVWFDCGPHGYTALAAHGHADALSFTLRAFGWDVVVDPGTYDYFTWPAWRSHFRSTRAHATVEVDGRDQSEMLGPFLWGARADGRCVRWEPRADGGEVSGEHQGYQRLPDPLTHRRTLCLSGGDAVLSIRDEFMCHGQHDLVWTLPLSEHCRVQRGGADWRVDFGEHAARLELDPRLMVELCCGQETPPAGWISRGYHRRVAAPALFGRARISGAVVLESRIRLERGAAGPSESVAAVASRAGLAVSAAGRSGA